MDGFFRPERSLGEAPPDPPSRGGKAMSRVGAAEGIACLQFQ